jgi:hypothetical protein
MAHDQIGLVRLMDFAPSPFNARIKLTSALTRLGLTLAGFLFGFLVGAFMYFETVDPAVSQNVVLMGFVWILFSWIGGRLSYSITRDTIEKEEWEAAAQRRYDLNRMG